MLFLVNDLIGRRQQSRWQLEGRGLSGFEMMTNLNRVGCTIFCHFQNKAGHCGWALALWPTKCRKS